MCFHAEDSIRIFKKRGGAEHCTNLDDTNIGKVADMDQKGGWEDDGNNLELTMKLVGDTEGTLGAED